MCHFLGAGFKTREPQITEERIILDQTFSSCLSVSKEETGLREVGYRKWCTTHDSQEGEIERNRSMRLPSSRSHTQQPAWNQAQPLHSTFPYRCMITSVLIDYSTEDSLGDILVLNHNTSTNCVYVCKREQKKYLF